MRPRVRASIAACLTALAIAAPVMAASPVGAMNPASSPTRPDVLLYAPSPSGPRLVGVEWIVFDADQDMATVEHHSVLGQAFHGPMTHGLPVHYDLHAWIWQANPQGLFEDFNPNIRC